MRILVICLFLLPLCSQHARAETAVPGSNCMAITPGQANLMEWREQGLKNSSSTDYWIICPFERPAGRSEVELTVRAVNETDEPLGLSCNFREFFGGKQQPGGKSVTADISGGAYENLSVRLQPKEYDSVMNATCKLSKGIAVEATKVDFSHVCSEYSVQGDWAVTLPYGNTGYEQGILEVNLDGTVSGYLGNGSGIKDIVGTYQVDAETCIFGTVFTVGEVNFEGAGFLSEDQQTVEAVTVNSSGYFNNLTLIRVGGARAKGAGNANVINEQTILFPSHYGD